jgi:hypothetical protein
MKAKAPRRWNNRDLEALIMEKLRDAEFTAYPAFRFSELCHIFATRGDQDCREIDQALQRLRKAGRIIFKKGWRLPEQKPGGPRCPH